MNKETIETALKKVKYPGFSRDIVSFGLLRNIDIENQNVIVNLEVNTADPKLPLNLKNAVEEALTTITEIGKVEVRINVKAATSPASSTERRSQIQRPGHRQWDRQRTCSERFACEIRCIPQSQSAKSCRRAAGRRF